MGAETKAKVAKPDSSPAPMQDEIADIMNEIESLQQGMAQVSKPKATTQSASPPLHSVPTPPPPEDSISEETLAEFRDAQGADSASMEETLAGMKSEEEDFGTSLLDGNFETDSHSPEDVQSSAEAVMQAVEAEAEADALLAAAEVEADLLLAAAEADALAEAVALETQASLSNPESKPKDDPMTTRPGPRSVSPSAADSGCLTLSLQGSMTLKLKYEFEGQEVTLSFNDQFLRVELSDGTEFKIPVARPKAA